MEDIKEAFSRVKKDMDNLREELSFIKDELKETKGNLREVCDILESFSIKFQEKKEENSKVCSSTDNPSFPAETKGYSTDNLRDRLPKTQNLGISTGNEGVPTDRQTDRQTNQQTDKGSDNSTSFLKEDSITNALQMLNSLDSLKKEIRLKFKRLTEQEVLVFSTIYQQSEEKGYTDYKNLSKKLKLTESSIRDYVGRLINKGISLEKIKINNKSVQVSISPNLRRIASLATILKLREL